MPPLTTMSSNSSMSGDTASSSGFSDASNSPSSTGDNSNPEVFIYITFHKDKTSSRAPGHPRSLNSMVASFLTHEPMIPDVLLVDNTVINGVIAGRMMELFAQARPNSRRPDIKRFPFVVGEDEEAMDYAELDPNPARLRRRIRKLAARYRSIMVISKRDATTELANMRGWNIGEGLYEKIRFLEDHETLEMVLNGETTISQDYGPDAMIKY